MGIIIGFAVVLFVPVCVILTLIILLQDSKGEGLSSSAFGGAEMQSMLGSRGAATFLGKMTTWLAVGFMVISLILMRFYGEEGGGALTPIEQEQTQEGETPEPIDTVGEDEADSTESETPAEEGQSSKTEVDGVTPEETE